MSHAKITERKQNIFDHEFNRNTKYIIYVWPIGHLGTG